MWLWQTWRTSAKLYLPLVLFQTSIRNGNYGKLEVVGSGWKSFAKFTERCRFGKPKLWLYKRRRYLRSFFVSYHRKICRNRDVFKITTSIILYLQSHKTWREKKKFKILDLLNIFRVRKWLNVENVRVFFHNFFLLEHVFKPVSTSYFISSRGKSFNKRNVVMVKQNWYCRGFFFSTQFRNNDKSG